MKRYLLFSGDDYYPCGGWDDFENDFDNIEQAIEYLKLKIEDWCHVVDMNSMKIIKIGMRKDGVTWNFFDTEEKRQDYIYKKAKERGLY